VQQPIMKLIDGDGVGEADFDSGRQEAIMELVRGYELAVTKLHPNDHGERSWYRERLREVRGAAGLAVLDLLPLRS